MEAAEAEPAAAATEQAGPAQQAPAPAAPELPGPEPELAGPAEPAWQVLPEQKPGPGSESGPGLGQLAGRSSGVRRQQSGSPSLPAAAAESDPLAGDNGPSPGDRAWHMRWRFRKSAGWQHVAGRRLLLRRPWLPACTKAGVAAGCLKAGALGELQDQHSAMLVLCPWVWALPEPTAVQPVERGTGTWDVLRALL